jgi:inner membrane protein
MGRMPTIMTHAVVGLGLAQMYQPHPMSGTYWALAASVAMLPDLDAVTFPLGIPYRSRWGHRGLSHSLLCAVLVGLAVGLLACQHLGLRWWSLWFFCFVVMASHGALDAWTNGGLGVAFLSPFDPTRYFFPWRPVQVSPIGRGFFSRWGMKAFLSELLWIWVPLIWMVGLYTLWQAGFQ